MADLFHYFPINGWLEKVFKGVSIAKGLDSWWSKGSAGKPAVGEVYGLFFGAELTE
jgi:hypothetical protein